MDVNLLQRYIAPRLALTVFDVEFQLLAADPAEWSGAAGMPVNGTLLDLHLSCHI